MCGASSTLYRYIKLNCTCAIMRYFAPNYNYYNFKTTLNFFFFTSHQNSLVSVFLLVLLVEQYFIEGRLKSKLESSTRRH